MFDIFLEEIRSFEDIAYLIARILGVSNHKILVVNGYPESLPRELEDDDILCRVSVVSGDLKLMLQVYRAEVDYKVLASQVAAAFKDFDTRGLMQDEDEPWYDYESALMFDQTGQAKKVKLIQSDEDYEQNIYHVVHQA